jgi:hypothetical protein
MKEIIYNLKVTDSGSLKRITSDAVSAKRVLSDLASTAQKSCESLSGFPVTSSYSSLTNVSSGLRSYYDWVTREGFSDSSSLGTEHEMSYSDIKNLIDTLSFVIRNRNDDLLRGKDSSGHLIVDEQRYMSDNDGHLPSTLRPSALEDLISTLKKLEERRNQLGALEGVETERTHIQTLIDQRRKYFEKISETSSEPSVTSDMSMEDLERSLKWFKNAVKTTTGAAFDYYNQKLSSTVSLLKGYQHLMKLPEMEQETGRLGGLGKAELKVELKAIGMDGLRKRIKELQNMLSDTKNPMSASQRKEMTKLVASYEDYEKILRKSDVTVEKSWSSIKGIGGGISSLTETLQENRGAWATITGVVDSAIQIYQGVRTVISIVEALTGATETNTSATIAQGAAKTVEATIDTTATGVEVTNSAARAAASTIETTADVAGAAAKTMKAHASIPWVGIAIGAGMVATLVGIMESLPKFADGGIAYGPTLGIFGEYAGAKSNPEVVAPLDKLKSLIGDSGAVAGVRMKGRVRGRDIVMAIANETRINRKRTNIKL